MAACCGGGGGAEELADLGPGEFLVAGVVDGLGKELPGLGDEAGQGVQPDTGVAEPVGSAEPGELVDGLVEDVEAVVSASVAFGLRPKTRPFLDAPGSGSSSCRLCANVSREE